MGAIRKRGKHYVVDYYDGTGRRRWETIGPNLHEARRVLAQREWERRNGKFRLTRKAITMAEFIKKWEEDYLVVRQQLGRLKESTLVGYRVNLRHHIGPFFGRMRIDEIALPNVREFVKACSRRARAGHRAEGGGAREGDIQARGPVGVPRCQPRAVRRAATGGDRGDADPHAARDPAPARGGGGARAHAAPVRGAHGDASRGAPRTQVGGR